VALVIKREVNLKERDAIRVLDKVGAGVAPGLVPANKRVYLTGQILRHSTILHNLPENFRTVPCVGGLEHVIVSKIGLLYLASFESSFDIVSQCGNLQGLISVGFEPK
jgi:hypothetical protein